MSSVNSKAIGIEEWEEKIEKVNVSKEELNDLIMNYLVIEGYRDAAEKFSKEANMNADMDFASIESRMAIRNAIQNGNIDEAIERTNDINPEILDTNPKLYFHLQLQKLIELIRAKDFEAALEFSQEEMSHRGEENPELLMELENVMMLLYHDKLTDTNLASLLDYSQRLKTASELNAAILVAQSKTKDPRLPALLKLSSWAQGRLQSKVDVPTLNLFDASVSFHELREELSGSEEFTED